MSKIFSFEEVSKHNKEGDAWIIIEDKVYNISMFSKLHPGGQKVILEFAGKDATEQFWYFHQKSVLKKYEQKLCIGSYQDYKKPKESKIPYSEDSFGDLVPFGDPYWYQDWNSPYYNDSHRKVRRYVRNWLEENIFPNIHQWDENKQIPREAHKKAGDAGIIQLLVGSTWNKEYQGEKGPCNGLVTPEQFDAFHANIVTDEFCRGGSAGLSWGMFAGLSIGLPPVLNFGSEDLKKRVARDCCFGQKAICLAITEPQAGSDVASLTTIAKKTEDGQHYIINGLKKWITNGVFCDYFTVACRTGGVGMAGLSLILVEKSMPGVTTKQMKCQGVWASGTSFIIFEDVKVPVSNLIGKEGKGFKYIMSNFNHERLGLSVQTCRFARVCYEDAMKFAHKRKTFGKRLIDHPVIRNKLAHMARQIEATHSWIELITYQLKTMKKVEAELRLAGPIALCKAQCTQTFEYCAREALQIFGGLGYTRGSQGERVERLYREVRALAIPGGSEEIMLDLGARQASKFMPTKARL